MVGIKGAGTDAVAVVTVAEGCALVDGLKKEFRRIKMALK